MQIPGDHWAELTSAQGIPWLQGQVRVDFDYAI